MAVLLFLVPFYFFLNLRAHFNAWLLIGQFTLDILMQSVTTRQQTSHAKLAGVCGETLADGLRI
jgi:hypothetical protein